jgi:predicted N-formylglutamate amidohydrolase
MPFKPPLSFDELKAIQDRNADNTDVRNLLWEIRRLHAVVLRADQLARSMPEASGAIGMIAEELRRQIKDDPAVLQAAQSSQDLLGPPPSPEDE